jgi:hypothetical protein
MFGKRYARALAVITVASLIMATTALADVIQADTDAVATSAPSANGLDATQSAGATVEYDYSAFIKNNGNPTDDVFAGAGDTVTVSVAVTQNDLGWTTSLNPDSFIFDDYGQNKAGQLSVTVPSGAASGDVNHIKVEISVTNVSNGSPLTPASLPLNYTVTVGTLVASNSPPLVEAGGPYSGFEGSSIAINGASASDPDVGDSIASLSWTKLETGFDAGYSCTLTGATTITPSLSCTDNGSVTLTLTATDTHGVSSSDTATVTVNNANPVVVSAALAAGATTCSVNLTAAFTDAGVNDTHTASVAWGDTTSSAGTVTEAPQSGSGTVAASHSYSTIGSYTATVTVTDDNGGSGSLATNSFLAGYTTGGILQPINPGPPLSIFKLGSTIPVKIQVTNCDGSIPNTLALYITIKAITGDTLPSGDYETTSTSAADSGNVMRFSTNQYIYNLYTKTPYFPDPTATYTLTIHYGSSGGPTVAAAVISLKK